MNQDKILDNLFYSRFPLEKRFVDLLPKLEIFIMNYSEYYLFNNKIIFLKEGNRLYMRYIFHHLLLKNNLDMDYLNYLIRKHINPNLTALIILESHFKSEEDQILLSKILKRI